MSENSKTNSRRDFIKKTSIGAAGITIGAMGFSAKSYARIIGSNDRLGIGIVGLGRRLGAYVGPVTDKKNNVDIIYLCDVMKSQREKAGKIFSKLVDYTPQLENDFFKVINDPKVDAIFNATPDHWHAPGTWLALEKGKHVYVEKPISHNPFEGEILIKYQKKYNKVVQMGNQQRSSLESIDIIKQIHEGVIGTPSLAVAFYTNARGESPLQKNQAVPDGLDWDLWQGPAPRREYTYNTWDYNWHWYGWEHGTAETGNNATHELDIARWALQVDFPKEVFVDAAKRQFVDDGWEMYDTMDATFRFEGNKTIKWDGKSRNGYDTYKGGRGTIIYGSEGSVFVDRGHYKLFDRSGKLMKKSNSGSQESGTQLGGGGDLSTMHVENFFDAIRGKAKQKSPVDEGAKSTLMCHLANIASRTDELLKCDTSNGHITNSKKAMKLWKREYEKGWEPNL